MLPSNTDVVLLWLLSNLHVNKAFIGTGESGCSTGVEHSMVTSEDGTMDMRSLDSTFCDVPDSYEEATIGS